MDRVIRSHAAFPLNAQLSIKVGELGAPNDCIGLPACSSVARAEGVACRIDAAGRVDAGADPGADVGVYAELGWRVLPVHSVTPQGCSCGNPACRTPGKHPLIGNWPKLATTEFERIGDWRVRWPDANVGIAIGRASGLFALDIDPQRGGDELLAELESAYGPLPPTSASLTGGGGRHLLFGYPTGEIATRTNALGPGIDVRAATSLPRRASTRAVGSTSGRSLPCPRRWASRRLRRGC